jgi:PHD/YefM family antitoxin component YafN of YafNO toxin-antitoxin module
MNIEELKKLVKGSTAVLVLDNGEPSFVILNYNMYKDLVLQESAKEIKINHLSKDNPALVANGISGDQAKSVLPQGGLDTESEILERINKDILALKEEIEKEEKTPSID